MDALKAYLVKHFGLAADADEAAVRKLAGEKLTASQILELTTPLAAEKTPVEKLLDALTAKAKGGDGAVTASVASADATNSAAAALIKAHGIGQPQPDSAVQPADLLAGAAKAAAAGTVNVRKASARFSDTKARKVYPMHTKSGASHPMGGQDVVIPVEGRPAYDLSDREKALTGAFLQHRAACLGRAQHLVPEWQKALLEECVREMEFVGDINVPGYGSQYIHTPRKLTEIEVKTVVADSTSGGTNIVPYQFDDELITFPLLYNELFPRVTVDDVEGTNQVIQGSIQNMTVSSGPTEDGATNISLQSTASLIAKLTWNMYPATGAITFGRDFLSDTPTNVLQKTMQLYTPALGQWLDNKIAAGNGTSEPQGVTLVSGPNTYSFKNGSAGPQTVTDWEQMQAGMPVQYRRAPGANLTWLFQDGMWWRIRGLSVSSTDQRRIFGYNDSKYSFYDTDVKVNASLPAATVVYFNAKDYVMKRRKGLEFQTSQEGQTLMLLNELLVVARSRWSGQMIRPLSVVLATNASVHG